MDRIRIVAWRTGAIERVNPFAAAVLVLSALLFIATLPSQSAGSTAPTWARAYGTASDGEYGRVVRETPDGGYIVGAASFGGSGLTVLLKLDPAGAIVWQKSYGASYLVTPNALEVVPSGGYVLVSHNDQDDARLVRLDEAGTILWEKLYGGPGHDNLVAIANTADGGFIVGGATNSWGAGQLDFWILKLDAFGAVQWERVIGTPAYEFVRATVPTADGGYAIVGETDSDGWALKTDGQGNVVSSTRMAGTKSFNGKFWTVVATPDGGFVAGASGSVLVRFTASGSVAWKKSYGAYVIRGLAGTADGGFVATGAAAGPGGNNVDAMVLRLDADGNPLRMKTYGSQLGEQGWDVVPTADGGYIVAGETAGFGRGNYDIWVLKLDAEGSIAASCPKGIGVTQRVSGSTAKNVLSTFTVAAGPTTAAVGTWSSSVADTAFEETTQCSA